ncbi:MAG: chemotaxis protein CheW [Magnetovibrionaceae bacterium]
MDDLLSEFLTETSESLAVIDVELVKFEQNPNDADILSNIFRLVHTIKGTCGFLGLPRLESVAHAGENVLGKFRDGALEVTPDAVTLILRCIDTIRDLLAELEETGQEPDGDDSEIIAQLNDMAEGKYHAAPAAAAPAADPVPAPAPAVEDTPFPVAKELLDEVAEAEAAGVTAASDAQMVAEMEAEGASDAGPAEDTPFPVAKELLDEVAEAEAAGVTAASDAQMVAEMAEESAAEQAPATPAPPAPAPTPPAVAAKPPAPVKKDAGPPAEKKEHKESSIAASSIRVNVDVLENLMTLVSEMVLTRNQLLQMIRGKDDSEFAAPLQRLSLITTDLQEGVMKTRMQPIGNAWAKLPRIVRDLSVESGKKIELKMLGAETELDRQVLELIKDPLTHMVRNSADHGLEDLQGRRAAGKPETGTITLNAFHEGGHIIIEIKDDGRGLNLDKIKEKAIANGVATEAEMENMADQQIYQFIFAAGFSTAEKVTSVSGRGVGMDVVRTNIEKIGGTIQLKSVPGKGSTFTIKIPLTLAIVSALIVECGGERFAVPQISVLELVRASNNSEHTIEMINNSPVLRLRNRLLPLVSLRELLALDALKAEKERASEVQLIKQRKADALSQATANGFSEEEAAQIAAAAAEGDDTEGLDMDMGLKRTSDEVFIVVTQVGNYTFGIIVDRVFDTEEIVVKPTAPILRDIPFYSGNTILGDGSVIMILDPNGIAASTGQAGMQGDGEAEAQMSAQQALQDETTSLLIFRAGGQELKAVPLALVARLEEVDMAETESAHGNMLVQYRGRLMPLVPFNDYHEWKSEGRQPILVFTEGEHSMGLVVDEIVDIVEDKLKVELSADAPGLIGSAIIAGKATDVIDAGHFLTRAFPDWFGANQNEGFDTIGGNSDGRRVLLVDDSPFFRNLLSPLLSVAGYQVTSVESAEGALDMRERGYEFDVIISDIEMPGMSGFEFCADVRSDERWREIPMVALSSHATERDFERGREVGFNDYVAKFDREALVSTIADTVAMASVTRN